MPSNRCLTPPGNRDGKIGLLTQSGHNGRPFVQGAEFGVGFSRWVPTGNEVDLELGDFLEYFAYDDDTQVIGAYVEGFKSADQLRRALQAANDNDKPVVMLKIGETEAGSRMASSHTGHLTGSDAVVNGLFAQHGVTRVGDLDELLDTAALFSKFPADAGPNVCMYSISGGSGTLMMEQAEKCGISLPELTAETQKALHEIIPSYLTVSNPVDNGGTLVLSIPQEKRLEILDLIANDPNVDVLVVGLTAPLGPMTAALANDVLLWSPTAPIPTIVTWNSYKIEEPAFSDVVASGVPTFRSFRNCFTRAARVLRLSGAPVIAAHEAGARRGAERMPRRLRSPPAVCSMPMPRAWCCRRSAYRSWARPWRRRPTTPSPRPTRSAIRW